jgi:hypothetical protein
VGETPNQPFQLSFNACLKVDFQGSRVTSDGGLILIRELDERLGMEKLIAEQLSVLAYNLGNLRRRLVLAESHLTRRLFGMMLRRIWALPTPAG